MTKQIIFEDNFENDLSKWNNFGNPSPYIKDGYYIPNGDSCYSSGSYTKDKFKIKNGLTLEFKAYQQAGDIWDMFYHIGFGKDFHYVENNIPYTAVFSIYGHNPDKSNNPDIEMAVICRKDGEDSKSFPNLNDGKEHIYKIMFDNNKINFFIDDNLLYEYDNDFIGHEVPLLISGRSYNKSNGIDYIKLYYKEEKEPISTPQEPSQPSDDNSDKQKRPIIHLFKKIKNKIKERKLLKFLKY